MELGQRIRQARLEAGLSQRQLCGDTITRNMLSQIENGSARPSMNTLQYLSARLGKPMSFFLEEAAVLSPNQSCILQARTGAPEEVLALLKGYRAPDPVFDPERYLLEALACLSAAETALAQERTGYAASLLQQAAEAGDRTVYYTPELEHRRILLCCRAGVLSPAAAAAQLPERTEEGLLRAAAALSSGDPARCGTLLDSLETRNGQWHYLKGECLLAQGSYREAAAEYLQAETWSPRQVCPRLEHCYRELGDYKNAYEYACKQR